MREIINKLITDFNLEVFPTMDIETFKRQTRNPNAIMFDDRRTQITLEMVNNRNLRIPFSERALELLKKYQIPITPRLAGEFALRQMVYLLDLLNRRKRTIVRTR